MFEPRGLDWFVEEDLLDEELITFEEVQFAPGDVTITGQQLASVQHDECSIGLVVEGSLTVDGPVLLDEQHALFVGKTLRCSVFSVFASPFQAELLEADAVIFGLPWEEMMESWDSAVKAKVVLDGGGELPPNVAADHVIQPGELGPVVEQMLVDSFADVLAALERGITLDDAWVRANAALCRNEVIRRKYLD